MSPRSGNGFTLVELAISLALFGIGLIAVTGLVTATSQRLLHAALRTEQLTVAQQHLERASGLPFDALQPMTDTVVAGLGSYVVERVVERLDDRLKRVSVIVTGPPPLFPRTVTTAANLPLPLPAGP